MISMYTKQEIIIKSYREGKSQRSISRELEVSRPTVKKIIKEYEAQLKEDPSTNVQPINEYMLQEASYNVSNRKKLRLTQEVQAAIDQFLDENNQKKQQGLRKQLLKKHDILLQLRMQGFDIGYTTVCNYIRLKGQPQPNKEAYIRQQYLPGETCEFDWGEIKLYIDGKLERLQLAVFTCCYSNYRYAAIYHRQDTLSFMESHVSFFDHVKGVFRLMVYDNMRVAVSKFVGPKEKEPTRALLQMRGHYQYSHRFCNAYRGNEKGHVERSVEYIRRKAFGVKSRFDTIDQAGQWLKTTLVQLNSTKQEQTGKTADELFVEESKVLGTLPQTILLCTEQVQLRVDKYATVSYRTNRYSVPDHLVGEFIDAQILSHQVHIYHGNKLQASHARNYGKHQWIINIEHYLATFKKKPGALPDSIALASSSYLKQVYQNHFDGHARDFIDFLNYCYQQRISNEKLEESVQRLLSPENSKINIEKLKALLGNNPAQNIQVQDNPIAQASKEQLLQITALLN